MNKELMPKLIPGGRSVDDRGNLSFNNDLDLSNFKRYYLIENHSNNFVRAWHGHLEESKVFICIEGSFLVGAVRFNQQDRESPHRFVLDSKIHSALFIPKGFANGSMNLSDGAKLLVFSDSTLEASKSDDFRFDWDYWNIWNIERR